MMNKIIKMVFSSVFISLLLSVLPGYAFDGATLKEIKISSKDNYSYKIILKADKDVPVEKFVTADNKIVIDVKNARAASFVNTVYNNTPEIDNVIVQSVNNDKIRIFIQGLNIASSKVILDSRDETLDFVDNTAYAANNNSAPQQEPSNAAQSMAQNQQTPVINLAANSTLGTTQVQPAVDKVESYKNELSGMNLENNNLETVKNSMAGNLVLKKIFSKSGFDWLLRIFAIIFIAIGAFKLFSKPQNVTIDLSQENMKLRELELYRAANDKKELLTKSLGSGLNREMPAKKPAYGANKQYAANVYNNSQLPPQKLNRAVERPSTPINPELSSEFNRASKLNSALKTAKPSTETRRPAANNTKINQKAVNTAKANVDNIKFLESMAAIYQKSGRADLAQNIRRKIAETKAMG